MTKLFVSRCLPTTTLTAMQSFASAPSQAQTGLSSLAGRRQSFPGRPKGPPKARPSLRQGRAAPAAAPHPGPPPGAAPPPSPLPAFLRSPRFSAGRRRLRSPNRAAPTAAPWCVDDAPVSTANTPRRQRRRLLPTACPAARTSARGFGASERRCTDGRTPTRPSL